MEMERKSLPLEVKAVDESGIFEGHAAAFGNIDAVGDIILPGAFKATLKEHKARKTMPALLWYHDARQPLGPLLSASEDEKGLLTSGQLLFQDVVKARESLALLKAKAISGMSIGYFARDYSFDEKTGIRTLKRIDLYEVSLVTFPANDLARVTDVKAGDIKTIRDFEAALRDALGFSANEAKRIAQFGFKTREVSDSSAELCAIMNQISKKYLEV